MAIMVAVHLEEKRFRVLALLLVCILESVFPSREATSMVAWRFWVCRGFTCRLLYVFSPIRCCARNGRLRFNIEETVGFRLACSQVASPFRLPPIFAICTVSKSARGNGVDIAWGISRGGASG